MLEGLLSGRTKRFTLIVGILGLAFVGLFLLTVEPVISLVFVVAAGLIALGFVGLGGRVRPVSPEDDDPTDNLASLPTFPQPHPRFRIVRPPSSSRRAQ